jgi:hypothetical protein
VIPLKTKIVLVVLLSTISFCSSAYSQEQEISKNDPPQILTSDLVLKQIIEDPTKVVSFVIIDSDNISEVTINGEKQEFIPAPIIEITKEFHFDPGKTLIEVVATDEAGNTREKTFLVGLGEGIQLGLEEETKPPEFFWKANFGLKYESDSNPTLDLSSPIDIAGIEIEGVVSDEEQTDIRKTGNVLFSTGYGNLFGYLGGILTKYSKKDNEVLNSEAVFTGIGYTIPFSKTSNILLNGQFIDINVDEHDYSQNKTLSAGAEFEKDNEKGNRKHLFSIDYTQKDFAEKERDVGSRSQFKWKYNSLDAQKLDEFQFKLAIGSDDDGYKETEYTFVGTDFDWFNKWETGLKFDIGFGIEYRNYPNDEPLTDEFGKTRVDTPLRFSTGLGWEFPFNLELMYNFEYTFNLSNDTPYVRIIHGLFLSYEF